MRKLRFRDVCDQVTKTGANMMREIQIQNQEQRQELYGLKVTVHAAPLPSGGSRIRAAEEACGDGRRKRTQHSRPQQPCSHSHGVVSHYLSVL